MKTTKNVPCGEMHRIVRHKTGVFAAVICMFMMLSAVAWADCENVYVTLVHPNGDRCTYPLPGPTPTETDRGAVLTAAKNDATSGDTIIVGAGTAQVSNLLKNGVNWHFVAGSTIVRPTSSNAAIFDDYASGTNGPVNCIISGQGKFDGTTGGVIFLKYTGGGFGSNIDMTADTIASASTTIYSRAATLHIKANIISSTYAAGAVVWWFSGPMHVEAHEILGSSNAAIYSTAPSGELPGYYLWVQANLIKNTAGKAIFIKDSEASAREWIQALQIEAPIAIYMAAATNGSPGLTYVRAEKVFGQINHNAGTLYVEAQKISDDGLNSNLIALSGGSSWCNILQLDDAGLTGSPAAVVVSGGIHYLRGSSLARGTSGDGIVVSGGAFTINGVGIITQSGARDLVQSGGTLTVLGCGYNLSKTSGTISQGDPVVAIAPGYGVGSTYPADGNTYQFFRNTGDSHIYGWNGSSWVRLDN